MTEWKMLRSAGDDLGSRCNAMGLTIVPRIARLLVWANKAHAKSMGYTFSFIAYFGAYLG